MSAIQGVTSQELQQAVYRDADYLLRLGQGAPFRISRPAHQPLEAAP